MGPREAPGLLAGSIVAPAARLPQLKTVDMRALRPAGKASVFHDVAFRRPRAAALRRRHHPQFRQPRRQHDSPPPQRLSISAGAAQVVEDLQQAR